MPYKLRLTLLAWMLIPFLLSCATKAYQGPDRPEGELSTVYFYNLFGVTLTGLTVDGVDQGFGMGLSVLAGEHTVQVGFETNEKQCVYSNYWCGKESYYGICKGSFRSAAQKSYRIEVSGIGESVWLSVLESESREPVGQGECRVQRTRFRLE
jgi:hypothetical protein